MQSDLTWHHHINVILASANCIFGLMKHKLKQAPSHLKKLAYTTLVIPKIEYACAIWDPNQDYIVRNLESLQSRAARLIFSNYSPYSSATSLKNRAKLDPYHYDGNMRRCPSFINFIITSIYMMTSFYHPPSFFLAEITLSKSNAQCVTQLFMCNHLYPESHLTGITCHQTLLLKFTPINFIKRCVRISECDLFAQCKTVFFFSSGTFTIHPIFFFSYSLFSAFHVFSILGV